MQNSLWLRASQVSLICITDDVGRTTKLVLDNGVVTATPPTTWTEQPGNDEDNDDNGGGGQTRMPTTEILSYTPPSSHSQSGWGPLNEAHVVQHGWQFCRKTFIASSTNREQQNLTHIIIISSNWNRGTGARWVQGRGVCCSLPIQLMFIICCWEITNCNWRTHTRELSRVLMLRFAEPLTEKG